jgi:hypothetical protein|tara:strand:- start:1060 stop:1476 length:417 start_codon:yes stop_codon:yes gene_type:complete
MDYKQKDIEAFIKFLKQNEIGLDRARKIIHKVANVSPTNRRTLWKMTRFSFYVWQRLKEHKENMLGSKINTCKRVVNSPEYLRMYKTFPFGPFSEAREVKNLNLLITDPRQQIHFRSRNFVYKGTSKNIPQELLDKIC